MSLPLNDFLTFLNQRQRDPRLNEILFPITKKSEAVAFIQRHEKGRNKGTCGGRGRERGVCVCVCVCVHYTLIS